MTSHHLPDVTSPYGAPQVLNDWERKAHRLIAEMAHQAWEQANRLPNGRLRKRHAPYTIPAIAAELVDILGMHDREEAEERAKAVFMQLHDVPELARD